MRLVHTLVSRLDKGFAEKNTLRCWGKLFSGILLVSHIL